MTDENADPDSKSGVEPAEKALWILVGSAIGFVVLVALIRELWPAVASFWQQHDVAAALLLLCIAVVFAGERIAVAIRSKN